MAGIRTYPTMILTTDWNALVAYLGGADANAQINTARILLNTSYPNYALSSWESATAGYINAAKLMGQVLPYVDSTPADPTGSSSTTGNGLMMGLAVAYTPTKSGIIQVQVEGQVTNGTTGDGALVTLYQGTGGAPSNQGALTGSAKGKPAKLDAVPTGAKKWPFGITTVISGLALGTAIWLDLALAAVTGGTANLYGLEIVVTEL